MLRLQRGLLAPGLVLALAVGLALTIYGFWGLWTGQDPSQVWRWSGEYLWLFVGLTALAALAGLVRGPLLGGITMIVVLTACLGYIVPLAVVLALGLSSLALGQLVLRDADIDRSEALLVGIAVFGTLLSILVQWPINTPGTWTVLFGLPLLLGWRYIRSSVSTFIAYPNVGPHQYLLISAISAAAMIHVLAAMMPEKGSDALAVHLFLAARVAYDAQWHFDVGQYIWAVMPMFVDWLYAAGFMFAGETGARLVNVGGVLLLAFQIHRMARWAGADNIASSWAVLIFLVTPLTFTESSSLFIEGTWSALVIGGSLALFRVITDDRCRTSEIVSSGILLGAAVAGKLVAAAFLPVLAILVLVTAPKWYRKDRLPVIGMAIIIFFAVAAVPYVRAYIVAENPVFPFFNAYFRSPLYPSENFEAPNVFEKGLHFGSLYDMTFYSTRYIEGKVGTAGFQWLLLVIPGLLAILLDGRRRGMAIAFTATGWLWVIFAQTAYLRYVYPAFALGCVVLALLLVISKTAGRWAHAFAILLCATAVCVNLLHLAAGTNDYRIDWSAILNERAKDQHIQASIPLRAVVSAVNALNVQATPVAFFSQPNAGILRSEALHNTWYNPRFADSVARARNDEEFGKLLDRERVDYIIADEAAIESRVLSFIENVSHKVLLIGTTSLWKLNDEYRFSNELLASTDFTTGWEFAEGTKRLPTQGIEVAGASAAVAKIPVAPNAVFRYEADTQCAGTIAPFRLQVNWVDQAGKFLDTNIKVYNCTSEGRNYNMDLTAPEGAAMAIVYASAHSDVPVIFRRISFRN